LMCLILSILSLEKLSIVKSLGNEGNYNFKKYFLNKFALNKVVPIEE